MSRFAEPKRGASVCSSIPSASDIALNLDRVAGIERGELLNCVARSQRFTAVMRGRKTSGPGAAETARTLILDRKGSRMAATIRELRGVPTVSAVLLDFDRCSPHAVFINGNHGFEHRAEPLLEVPRHGDQQNIIDRRAVMGQQIASDARPLCRIGLIDHVLDIAQQGPDRAFGDGSCGHAVDRSQYS